MENLMEGLDASKLLTSLADVTGGSSDDLLRSLPGTAMGGVALAFIGMILEFITLSGFHPSLSGDETKGDIPLRRREDVIESRKKRRERIRKNRKKQKLIAQLAKIETELDVYNGNLDFTDDDDNKDKDKNNDNVYNYELNYSNYDELLNLNEEKVPILTPDFKPVLTSDLANISKKDEEKLSQYDDNNYPNYEDIVNEKDTANPFPFANFEGEVQNFAQNFGDAWIRNNNNNKNNNINNILSTTSFMSTFTTTSKPKKPVGIQDFLTPLPPILPNENFKDNFDEKPSSMISGSLLGTGVLNLPDRDQNFLGLRSRAAILKQQILELDRALLDLQPELDMSSRAQLVRPLGKLQRLPQNPKAVYGYLTPAEPKYDIIYPYGINSDSVTAKLASTFGNFDNILASFVLSYIYNRYLTASFNLPTFTSLLSNLGRSLKDTPTVAAGLEESMAKFKILLDSNFNQTVENLEKLSENQKSNRKLELENHALSAFLRNKQILAYFGKIIQIFEKLFHAQTTPPSTTTTSTPPPPTTTTTARMNNSIEIITDKKDQNLSKSNNIGSLDIYVTANPVSILIDPLMDNRKEANPRQSRNLDIENEFSIFALFQNQTNFENNLDLSNLDETESDYEEVYELDGESLPKSFGNDVSASFQSLFRQWRNPEPQGNFTDEQAQTFEDIFSTVEQAQSFDKTNSTIVHAQNFDQTNLTIGQAENFDKSNLTNELVSFSNFFRNLPDTLLDESIKSQLQNLTENAGDYLARLIEDADLKEAFEEVANLTTQNHVAILKTYGVDNNLDRSAELGAIGLVMSGLAFAGMIGVAEIINHSGGFLKKGGTSDAQVLENRKFSSGSEPKSKRRRRRRKRRRRKSRREKRKDRRRRKRPQGMLMMERDEEDEPDSTVFDYSGFDDDDDDESVNYNYAPFDYDTYQDGYDDAKKRHHGGNRFETGNSVDRRLSHRHSLPIRERNRGKLSRRRNSNSRRRNRISEQSHDRIDAKPYYEFTDDVIGVDYPEFQDIVDMPEVNFKYNPLDYENYDMDEDGNIDMTKGRYGINRIQQPSNQVNRIVLPDSDGMKPVSPIKPINNPFYQMQDISAPPRNRKYKRDSESEPRSERKYSDRKDNDEETDYIYVDANGVDYTNFQDIEDGPDVNFTFTPLDYDNYETDQDGNIDMTKMVQEPPKRQENVDRRFLNHPPPKTTTPATTLSSSKTLKTTKPSKVVLSSKPSRFSSSSRSSYPKHMRGLNRPKSSRKLIRNHIIHFNETFNDEYDVASIDDKSTSTNFSHNDVQEKSSSSNDGEYVYEYLDVEDLLSILNQHKKNKTKQNPSKEEKTKKNKTDSKDELEYYDDDFYYDDDKVENVSNKNDSLKTENTTPKKKTAIDKKALSKTNDYEYPDGYGIDQIFGFKSSHSNADRWPLRDILNATDYEYVDGTSDSNQMKNIFTHPDSRPGTKNRNINSPTSSSVLEPDYIYVDGNGVDYFGTKDLQDDPKVNFTFTPLEYDNYDVDQFGNLDLTKPKPKPPKQESELAKRMHYLGLNQRGPIITSGGLRPAVLPRAGYRIRQGYLHLNRPRQTVLPKYVLQRNVANHNFLRSISSSFDFPALVALLGLWWAWNTYFVGILPTTFLSSLGRRSLTKDESSIEQALKESFEKFVRDFEEKRKIVQIDKDKTES